MKAIIRPGKHIRMVLTLIFVISVIMANTQMVVESLDGAVCRVELNSFKSYVQSVEPGSNGNLNPANDWVTHDGGAILERLSLLRQEQRNRDRFYFRRNYPD